MAAWDDALAFATPEEWDVWLLANAASSGGVWLRIGRKGAGAPLLSIREAADVGLCHGWIDSHRRGGDEQHFRQRYSPRRAGSPWSRVNVERAEALLADGRMRPAGLASIDAARADGRWDAAYAGQATAVVPPELTAALAADPPAALAFAALDRTAQYLAYLPLLKTRTAEARAARLAALLAALRAGPPAG